MFWIYQILFLPLSILFVIGFALSNRRGLLSRLPRELQERFAFYPPELSSRMAGRPVLWFHAASLGEIKALGGLIAKIRAQRPGHAFVLTTANSVARDQAELVRGIDAAMLAPLDLLPLTNRAMAALKPKALILAETELWPALIRSAKAAGARVALVNARLSEKSASRYRYIAPMIRPALAAFDEVCAQTAGDAESLVTLGAQARVSTTGNMKYDALLESKPDLAPLRSRLAAHGWDESDPVFVAGSTHAGEETAILDGFKAVRAKERPNARLILAPRHLERLPEVRAALDAAGLQYALWSAIQAGPHGAPVLLMDQVGVLADLYGIAKAAFVGGTVAPKGGHNLLEPIRFGVPIVFGPHTGNVKDVADALLKADAALQVPDAAGLTKAVSFLLTSGEAKQMGARAQAVANAFKGATDRTLTRLLPLL